jgi:hypothetical protein
MSDDFERQLVTAYKQTQESDELEDNSLRLRKTRMLLLDNPPPFEPGAYILVVQVDVAPYWSTLSAGLTVGRTDEAGLKIVGKWVSTVHCKFNQDESDWFVEDLESTNGLQVNGTEHDRHFLSEGDAIQVGNCLLIFLQVREDETLIQ